MKIMPDSIDIRECLVFMNNAPIMCAVTREGFLVQVMTWLIVAGADDDAIRSLERVGIAPTVPSSIVDVEHLCTRINQIDPWTQEIVRRALAVIPDPCVVKVSRQ